MISTTSGKKEALRSLKTNLMTQSCDFNVLVVQEHVRFPAKFVTGTKNSSDQNLSCQE